MCVQNSIFGQEWLDTCICKTEKPIKQAVVVSHLYPPNLICKVCASSSVIKVLQAVASGHNLATLIDTEFDGISIYLAVMCHTTCFLLFIIIISSSIIIISKCIIMVCLYLWGVTVSISYLTFSKACSLFITCLLYSPHFLYFFVFVNILHWVSLFFLCLGLILHFCPFIIYLLVISLFVCFRTLQPLY